MGSLTTQPTCLQPLRRRRLGNHRPGKWTGAHSSAPLDGSGCMFFVALCNIPPNPCRGLERPLPDWPHVLQHGDTSELGPCISQSLPADRPISQSLPAPSTPVNHSAWQPLVAPRCPLPACVSRTNTHTAGPLTCAVCPRGLLPWRTTQGGLEGPFAGEGQEGLSRLPPP